MTKKKKKPTEYLTNKQHHTQGKSTLKHLLGSAYRELRGVKKKR